MRRRAFVNCANGGFLVHEQKEHAAVFVVFAVAALFHVSKPETDHGSHCVARLASEIKFEEDDGTPFPGPRAEPILPCANICREETQRLFQEAVRALPVYDDFKALLDLL